MSAADNEQVEGTIEAVCAGGGGIPKQIIDEGVVGTLGIEGDAHRFHLHGGEDRALCLISVEAYASMRADDVDCSEPGTFGENVLTRGLDDARLRPGDKLALGDEVVVEIYDIRIPCKTLKAVDARFPDLMLGRSGWVCRVVEPGRIRAGMRIQRIEAGQNDDS